MPSFRFLSGVFALVAASSAGMAAQQPLRVSWDGLVLVVGKTVSIGMPDGAAISGKAIGLEPDALLVDVKSTTDPQAFPKGALRVPRPTLRFLQMRTKGKAFRILGTAAGSIVGLVAGAAAAWGIQGGIFGNRNEGKSAAAFFGIWVGGTAGGYFAGNAADKRWTPVEITP